MREISAETIVEKLSTALEEINYTLNNDLKIALKLAKDQETNDIAKNVLDQVIENGTIAQQKKIPLCQDTGMVVIFAEIGQQVHISDQALSEIIEQSIKNSYQNLRKSIVQDPLHRINTQDNTPGILHTEIVPGDQLIFKVMAKGGGAENKSQLKMFNPTASQEEISNYIVETVKAGGGAVCPPVVVGVGIGGNFEYAPFLAKKALLREIGLHHASEYYQEFEKKVLEKINKLNVGPAGYGGKTTALAVNIETYPCHIASLPVAVNIQCHSDRYKEIVI